MALAVVAARAIPAEAVRIDDALRDLTMDSIITRTR